MYGDQSGEFVFGYWGLKGLQANLGSYSNPGTQVGPRTQNKDFGAVSQTDLTKG